MNALRFAKKLVFDRSAAWASARLVARSVRGQVHWALRPDSVLRYRLPTGGVIVLGREDSFTKCFWPGTEAYEPDVEACIRRFLAPGQTFIDCGANVGLFTIVAWGLMGRRGRVVSIEANPETLVRLRENRIANGLGEPVGCAVADSEGELELFLSAAGDVYSSLATGGLVKSGARSVRVPARPLDRIVRELRLDAVDAIKIDVEGAEMSVLRSASETVRRFRPWCVVEYSAVTWPALGASPDDLVGWCRDHEYEIGVYDAARRVVGALPDDAWQRTYLNVMLVPRERVSSFFE